ncbi:DUF5048 domain-containing protein [Butyrivibrio sp. INlla21]|uniref:DUF5048 domain-containing protein n=1 Tax=Butyrivibrio sp. INlla21 TaxID=1520811 RepID=UPI0008F06ACF|nr:DUF5048 domain-containing protein [Butyrivibrio sp. INlla21]SFU35976.1 protein of unknown function [Butyrivibrio sp. INlla21]
MYNISVSDVELLKQSIIDLRVRITIYHELTGEYLDQLECGIISGSCTVSAESDVRRTFSLECTPVDNDRLVLNEEGMIWLNRIIKLEIGVLDTREQVYTWYEEGRYVYTNMSATFDPTTNTISLSCNDLVAKLDGTKNGQIGGAEIIEYPAYVENESTGAVIHYNHIRDQVITTLTQLSFVRDYEVDEIGEYKGMPQYNADYETYRNQSRVPVQSGALEYTWNALPYDQEFSVGTSVWSVLTAFRDLYPNYEMYFDETGTFICQMIPSRYMDDTVLDNNFFRDVLISENTSIDLSTVRNICEVFGESIEADFYSESTSLSGTIYSATVSSYDQYYNGDVVALLIRTTNPASASLKINSLANIPIYDEYTEEPISARVLNPNTVYTFKIKSKRVDNASQFRAYLLGHYLPHGIDVLTDGTVLNETWTDQSGTSHRIYSKDYFQAKYNCECVNMTIIPDSPFTVQKLGEILDVKTGGEYENITSDALAVNRAIWENWKNCRLTDSITLSTKITPFADVNVKVEYRPSNDDVDHQYIVKNVSHDWSGGTTSWTLMKFYPLYDDENYGGTHEILSKYTHGTLARYTHSQMSNLV